MGGAEDLIVLNDTISRLSVAMHLALPAGRDLGTIATALIEMTAHAIVVGFPQDERGPVVEHLQNYLMLAVDKCANDPEMVRRLTLMEKQERGARG
jgi:hypothetical protein